MIIIIRSGEEEKNSNDLQPIILILKIFSYRLTNIQKNHKTTIE